MKQFKSEGSKAYQVHQTLPFDRNLDACARKPISILAIRMTLVSLPSLLSRESLIALGMFSEDRV